MNGRMKCNECAKLCKVISETTSQCREWQVVLGGVLKESFVERNAETCKAFKEKKEDKALNVERGLCLSEDFFTNSRHWKQGR